MKKHETMFAEIVAIHNKNVGKTIHADVFLTVLFEKGFLVKNKDGSYYRHSFNCYISLLKKGEYLDFSKSKNEISIKGLIPLNETPKNLRDLSLNKNKQ